MWHVVPRSSIQARTSWCIMARPFAGVQVDVFDRGVKRHANPFEGLTTSVFAKALRPDPEPLDSYGDNYEDEETRFDYGNAYIHTPILLHGRRAFGNRREIQSAFLDGEIVFRLDPLDVDAADASIRATINTVVSLQMLNNILANDPRFMYECLVGDDYLDLSKLARRIHRAGVLVDRLSAADAEAAAPSGGYVTEGGMLVASSKPRACKVVPYGEARVRNLWPRARPGTRLFLRIVLVPRYVIGKKTVADAVAGQNEDGPLTLDRCCVQVIPFCEREFRPSAAKRVEEVLDHEHKHDGAEDGDMGPSDVLLEDSSSGPSVRRTPAKKKAPMRVAGVKKGEVTHIARCGPSSFIHGSLYTGTFTGEDGSEADWAGELMFVGTMLTQETTPPEPIHQTLVDSYACSVVRQEVDQGDTIQVPVETSIRSCMTLPLCQVAIASLP